MEEDDHDDLLRCSDDDSMTENEEPCLPTDKQGFLPAPPPTYSAQNKAQFMFLGFSLILSSTFLVILLPIYLESVNVKGDAYTMINFTSLATLLFLLFFTFVSNKLCSKSAPIKVFHLPIEWNKLLNIGIMYGLSGFMVVYAVDRKRVMCHLQDPIKGIVLVFSLVYYFFFCRKMMGLQRIFSSTTIIVGLFISVDYGLCDEFRCRGMEREHKADDAGPWSWQTHATWAAVYICGLSIFSAHYTLLERYLIPTQSSLVYTSISTSLLSTISKLVSNRDSSVSGQSVSTSSHPLITNQAPIKNYSALHLSLWLHIICWVLSVLLVWTDIIPSLGKASNVSEFLKLSGHGLACHFTKSTSSKHTASDDCGDVYIYGWLFLLTYIIYSLSSIRFLILSQSAVFTVAMTTTALPLTGIWWSLFNMSSLKNGLIIWNPSITGELICSLLGLPIVLLGVVLLFKSHFKEIEEANTVDNEYSTASTQLA